MYDLRHAKLAGGSSGGDSEVESLQFHRAISSAPIVLEGKHDAGLQLVYEAIAAPRVPM